MAAGGSGGGWDWGGGGGFFGFASCDGYRIAGEEVFLMKGGAGELEGELVEAFFEEAVDVVEGLLEVFGGGGFYATGAAGAAEEEVVGFDFGFEEVELAISEADVGEAGYCGARGGGGDGAGEFEELGGFIVHEGVGEGGEGAGIDVGFGFEDGVFAEEGEGAEGAAGAKDAGGEGGADFVFGFGDAGEVADLGEDAGVRVGDFGEDAVVDGFPGGEAGGEGEAGALGAEVAEGKVAVVFEALAVVHGEVVVMVAVCT